LHLRAGAPLTLFLYGKPQQFTVVRVLPQRGLAGAGIGAALNRNAFLPPGVLDAAARASGTQPRAVTFVSNRGGVERGARLTEPVTAEIRSALLGTNALVETPKRQVLDSARKTGDALGALFLMIGSFSIIAGALLLVNIFVMLAEDRKAQLGMLRAIGMKRASLVESFTLEGVRLRVSGDRSRRAAGARRRLGRGAGLSADLPRLVGGRLGDCDHVRGDAHQHPERERAGAGDRVCDDHVDQRADQPV
jgi:FtsX-like permease family